MFFKRRTVLRIFSVVGVSGLAGCSDSSRTTPANETTTDETSTATTTPSEATTSSEAATTTVTPTTTLTRTTTTTESPDSSKTTQTAKLAASDGDSDDEFGASVAVAGDGRTALVGAPEDSGPNGEWAGSAYAFVRSDGSWNQQAKLTATDGDQSDEFGASVALADDGRTALVGARGDEGSTGSRSGSAYVFTRSDGAWNQQTKLAASDGDSGDRFGGSVALADDGRTALVGAAWDEDPNGEKSGSTYAFVRSDRTWGQRAKLTATDGDESDEFGRSVAVTDDGSTALVGAYFAGGPDGVKSGAAYVFD